MYNFDIDNKNYSLPVDLSDITLRKFKEVSNYYEKNPIAGDALENETFEAYINFISVFLEIPVKELKKVKLTASNGFGIIELYSYLIRLIELPNMDLFSPILEFEHDGIKYQCVEEHIEVFKDKKPLEDMTFEQYEDCVTVLQNYDALKGESRDALGYLAAILFRPLESKWYYFNPRVEQYDSEKTKLRVDIFQDITMDKIYSAYFFLTEQTNILANDFNHYSSLVGKEELERALAGIALRN